MSAAIIRLGDGSAIVLDMLQGGQNVTRGVLLSLEGKTPGTTLNCVIVPASTLPAVIASLQLVHQQLNGGA